MEQRRRADMTERAAGLVPVLVDDPVAAVAGGILVDIVAAAGTQQVITLAPDQGVVALRLCDGRAADAAAAQQRVRTRTAGQQVVTVAAVDRVVAVAAPRRVVADTAADRVVVRAAVDHVIAAAADQQVIAVTAGDRVVRRPGHHRVVAARRIDAQRGVGPAQALVGRGAVEVGGDILDRQLAAIVEFQRLDPVVAVAPVLDGDLVGQIAEFIDPVADADDQVVADDVEPQILGADARAENDPVGAAVGHIGVVDMAEPVLRDDFVLVDDGVLAVAQVEAVDVVAAAAAQQVVADPAGQVIVADRLVGGAGFGRAVEGVVADAADQSVVAGAAEHGIVAVAAIDPVVAATDRHGVLAGAAGHTVDAGTGNHRVVAVAAVDLVVTARRVDDVVARAAADRVRGVGGRDGVVTAAGIDAEGRPFPRHRVRLARTLQVGDQTGHIDRGAVLELDLLDRPQGIVGVVEAQQVAQTVEVGVAVADADDQVVAIEGDPQVLIGDPRAEPDRVGTAVEFDRTSDRPKADALMEVVVILDLVVTVAAVIEIGVVAATAAQRVRARSARQRVVSGGLIEIVDVTG